MYTGTFAPWDNMPKLLRHDEMMHPLMVVTEFFEIDDVEGHGARFKEWRDYAVKEACYENEKHGPTLLLYTWEEHVRLIEAMYLLWHEYRNDSWQYKKASEEQLAQEKATWDYYPNKLNADQLASPYLVVGKFFKDMSLAVYRDHLYDWLTMALSKAVYRDPDLDAEAVITVYENMLELHEAAWLICQRHGDRPRLIKKDTKSAGKLESTSTEQVIKEPLEHFNVAEQIRESTDAQSNQFKPLYSKPTPACALGLQKVKEDILAHFPIVQLIVYLGNHSDPFTCYLLILISEEDKTEEGHLATNIENHLRTLLDTYIILHKASSALTAINKCSRFWNDVLSKGDIIYKSINLPAFETVIISHAVRMERAQFHWNLWGKQGEELLQGAAFFQESGNYRQAAFLLHRATETTLKGIIQAILGYRIQMHNIARMLRLTLLFTTELRQVFNLDDVQGVQLFNFLKESHAKAHYREDFKPDNDTIKSIHTIVASVQKKAAKIYLHFINQNES